MLKRNLNSITMSLVEVIIGILLLLNPVGFTEGIITGVGIILMVTGVCSVIRYFRTEPKKAALDQTLVKGFLTLLAGGFCAFCSHWFIVTFPVLTLVYGVMILITGITKLQWTADMIRMKRKRWAWTAISAAASILCGIVIVASPFSTTAVLWMFIGISLIVEAVIDLVGSIFGNRDRKEAAKPAE